LALFLHLLHKNTGVYYMLPLSCHMAQQCWKQDQTYKTKTRLQDQDQDRGRSETGLVIRPRSQTPRLFTTLCIFSEIIFCYSKWHKSEVEVRFLQLDQLRPTLFTLMFDYLKQMLQKYKHEQKLQPVLTAKLIVDRALTACNHSAAWCCRGCLINGVLEMSTLRFRFLCMLFSRLRRVQSFELFARFSATAVLLFFADLRTSVLLRINT